MSQAIDVLAIILPVFFTIGIGMLCRKIRLLSPEGIQALRKVAVNITLPAVSLAAFAEAKYSFETFVILVWFFLCCLALLVMGFAASKLLHIPVKSAPFLCTCFEGGMIGFSLYPLLYGSLTPFAIVDMGPILFLFTIYKVMLARPKSIKAFLHEIVTSPSLWALAVGVILGMTGMYNGMKTIGIQPLFDRLLDFIAGSTSFLVLLTIGYDLDFGHIEWRKTATIVGVRVVLCGIMLLITLAANRWLLGGMIVTNAAIMLFAMPAPFVITVFANDPEEKNVLSSTLSLMTLITIIVFVLMAIF